MIENSWQAHTELKYQCWQKQKEVDPGYDQPKKAGSEICVSKAISERVIVITSRTTYLISPMRMKIVWMLTRSGRRDERSMDRGGNSRW